jgi:hypothetical protein
MEGPPTAKLVLAILMSEGPTMQNIPHCHERWRHRRPKEQIQRAAHGGHDDATRRRRFGTMVVVANRFRWSCVAHRRNTDQARAKQKANNAALYRRSIKSLFLAVFWPPVVPVDGLLRSLGIIIHSWSGG